MNISAILGLFAAAGLLFFSISTSSKNPAVFGDLHGIAIVIGGTTIVALLCFPLVKIFNSVKIVIRKALGGEPDYLGAIQTIVEISNVYRTDPKGSLNVVPKNAHPFLRDAIQLLVDYGFNSEELDNVLTNSLKGKRKRDQEEVKVWHTISRFPPAFGLMGATLGMISFLQTMGEPGAQERIGPAMATALVATFYGLACANLALIPLAERLMEVSSEDITMREIIKDGILMVQEKKHPQYIEEYLKSFLAPKLRNKDMTKKAK